MAGDVYFASTSNGPRFPVNNRRVSPTEAGDYVIRKDIVRVAQYEDSDTLGHIRLKERPVTTYGGVGMLVKNYNTGEELTGANTWPPSPGQFYVSPYLGRVYFNASSIGMTVEAAYTGMGSIVDAVDMNYVNNIVQQIAQPITEVQIPANDSVTVHEKMCVQAFIESGGGFVPLTPTDDVTFTVHDITVQDDVRTVFVNTTNVPVVVYAFFLRYAEPEG